MQIARRRDPEGALPSRQRIVGCVEAYVRAHLDTAVPVTRLCRMLGVSERGLRNAFHEVHGLSPKRWMTAERLRGARRALCDARTRPVTVTDIATGHGFNELGRFAATYRHAFGEAPSETLRAAHQDPPAEAKGHPNV